MAKIVVAPTALATAIENNPIGPHPVTATVFAAISPAKTVCTALPNGSRMDAYSCGMPGSSFQIFDSGMTTYSAKAPSVSTPIIFTFWQICASPVRQSRHFPQATCISADTKSPSFTLVTVCLPELFQTQYFCQREEAALFDLAEPIPGPVTEKLAAAARQNKIVLIASLFEKR